MSRASVPNPPSVSDPVREDGVWKVGVLIVAGLIPAGLCAAIAAARQISTNHYVAEGLRNLILFSLRDRLNRWLLAYATLAVALSLASRITRRPRRAIARRIEDRFSRGAGPRVWSAAAALLGFLVFLGFASLLHAGAGRPLLARTLPNIRHLHAVDRVTSALVIVCAALAIGFGALLLVLLRPVRESGPGRVVGAFVHRLAHARLVLVMGLAVVAGAGCLNLAMFAQRRAHAPIGTNVLLISVDTLRADRLGCYGAERKTTPNIDALAARGVLFENAFAQAPWTLPSMASLHTALYPSEHGSIGYNRPLAEGIVTLAERLRDHLYTTIGVVSHHFVGKEFGFAQGFDVFNQRHIMGDDGISSPELTSEAIRALRRNVDRPFFLWVHYFDPHYTYISHPEFGYTRGYSGTLPRRIKFRNLQNRSLTDADVRYVRDVYDEEISFTDRSIGELLGALDTLGLREKTFVVFTADHGEEFMERGGFGHGKLVYQEQIRVPLIFAGGPAGEGPVRVRTSVETRRVGPTILEACGFGDEQLDEGGPLEWTGNEVKPTDCFSEGSYAWGRDERRTAVISHGFKLIENEDDHSYELYDESADPGEKSNLYSSSADETAQAALKDLLAKLAKFHERKRTLEAEETALQPATEEDLRSLGYIQ